MERRKISTLGKYSLVITLPKEWTNMNKLKGGDEVALKIQSDGALVVHPSFDFEENPNEMILPISYQEDEKMIQRKIIGCYLNGYNKIILTSEKNFTQTQQAGIRSIVRSLYMRIYESQSTQVTLQAFMDESLASVLSGIERMHIITGSMAKDIVKTIQEWDLELAKSVISLEEDVDQFMFFLTRMLRTAVNNPSLAGKLEVSMSDCFDYHLLINRIEYIADHITNIAEYLVMIHEYRTQISDNYVQNLLEKATRAFENYEIAVNYFFENKLEKTSTLIDYAANRVMTDYAILEHPNGNENQKKIIIICARIMDEITLINNCIADIAELTIDRHYNPS